MHRRHFLVTALAAAAFGLPASAQSFEDRLLRQLRRQGYNDIAVSRTMLGRTRIIAASASQRREIIFNPRTGEILRDYWQLLPGGDGRGARLISDDRDGGTNAPYGVDDGDDDGDADDDEDDDDDSDDSDDGDDGDDK